MPFKESLQYRECPDEPLKWYSWLCESQQISLNTTIELVNDEGHKTLCSYFTMFSLGLHFTQKEEIWNPDDADLSKLKLDVIVQQCPTMPTNDQKLIKEELETPVMKNPNYHRLAQGRMRTALLDAMRNTPFGEQLQEYNRGILSSDLYQGSRFLYKIIEMMSEYAIDVAPEFVTEGSEMAQEIKTRNDMSVEELHRCVRDIGDHIEFLVHIARRPNSEEDIMLRVRRAMRDPSRPIFSEVYARLKKDEDNTFSKFRAAIHELIPIDTEAVRHSRNTASARHSIHLASTLGSGKLISSAARSPKKSSIDKQDLSTLRQKYTYEQQSDFIAKLRSERSLLKKVIDDQKKELENYAIQVKRLQAKNKALESNQKHSDRAPMPRKTIRTSVASAHLASDSANDESSRDQDKGENYHDSEKSDDVEDIPEEVFSCGDSDLLIFSAIHDEKFIESLRTDTSVVDTNQDLDMKKIMIDGGSTSSMEKEKDNFVGPIRPIDVNIHVAKSNVIMKAIGIGTCKYKCRDNRGRIFNLVVPDTLYVPEASRSLLSASKLSEKGFQVILPSTQELTPSGLYPPRKTSEEPFFIPFETIGGLYYISVVNEQTRTPLLTKENIVVTTARKFGHCPFQVLKDTRDVVIGLEHLKDQHFPQDLITPAVRIGKAVSMDMPSSTDNRPSRANEEWHVDTVGPMKNLSVLGFKYNTSFTDGFSGYTMSYGSDSTSRFPEMQESWYANIARCTEIHGPPRVIRCDNASFNVSRRANAFRISKGIRTETICPSESHQGGVAERMNRTLVTGARTVLIASGLNTEWWHHAMMYQTFLQNIKFSRSIKSSPHVLMFGSKPDVSDLQEFGIEGWLFRREEQRQDKKFDARGEHVIFVGYPTNQKGFLVWCYERPGSRPKIVTSNNVVFGNVCPKSTKSPLELLNVPSQIIPDFTPWALSVEDLSLTTQIHIVESEDINLLLALEGVGFRQMKSKNLPVLLKHTLEKNLTSIHTTLTESCYIFDALVPEAIGSWGETSANNKIPRNIVQALSPEFVKEWGPAIDKENEGFVSHNCFTPMVLPSGSRKLPGIWVFTRKRDGLAKARFCVGGHKQIIGLDYFANRNYCAVLSSRDLRLLLALAAVENYEIYQTDIVQAFLYGELEENVDIYIEPPARYPCPEGQVLKLNRAIYGLHQAPVRFKKELNEWFMSQKYTTANDAQTVWFKRGIGNLIIIHLLYTDDFLHFTNCKSLFLDFQRKFKDRFDTKTGNLDSYLGTRIIQDRSKLSIEFNQSEYIEELLDRYKMADCTSVGTPIIQRFSIDDTSMKLTVEDQALYRNMIGSILYLSCWSRPDIAYAVSELSRFVSSPTHNHLVGAKHLLRYLKGSKDLSLHFSAPTDHRIQPHILWGYVDSDWAGCPDTRKSTSGYVLMLNGAAIAWKSKRQTILALSTAEAEFIAASSMIQEIIYIRRLLDNLGFRQSGPTLIYEDNSTCIKWANGAVGGTDRAKHIDLREHFIHEAQEKQIVHLEPIEGLKNIADLLTKPLLKCRFLILRKQLMGY